jgi:hypothetical protein
LSASSSGRGEIHLVLAIAFFLLLQFPDSFILFALYLGGGALAFEVCEMR